MTTTVWLRISAAIMLLFTAGHTMGGLDKWSPTGDNAVLRAMSTERFDVMGVSRTYLDFFLGFGWSISVTMLLQAALLWQLGSIARTEAPLVRPMIAAIAVANLVGGIIAWRFIFPVPAVFSAVLVVCLMMAYVSARKVSEKSGGEAA